MPVGECLQNSHPFKLKGGDRAREGSSDPSSDDGQDEGASGWDAKGIGHHTQTLFLNPNPLHWWYGIENVDRVRINGESSMALLNNGMQINTIMPGFVKRCSFEVAPLSDLVGRWVACVGLGNALTQPMGYIVIWVQVDRVQGYDKDQNGPGDPRYVKLCSKGTCHPGDSQKKQHCECDQRERDRWPGNALVNAWVAYLLAVQWATATVENDKLAAGESDPSEYYKVVTTKDTETIDAFLTNIIHARTGTAYTGEGINMMTQALCAEDGSLPQGLTVQNVYTEMCSGSKNVAVVVRNNMAYSQTLRKKTPVARAVTVMWVPEPPMQTDIMQVVEGAQGLLMPKLTMKQRQEKLFEELDLSRLESWPPKLTDSAWSLLAECHNIFSLEPSKLGCTHSTEHVIKVTNNTPFKEWFREIPPPLVEEVHVHLWEMLDSGMIHPSQSVWCITVALVWKKDGGLCICIDFCHLNICMKKDFYSLPRIQEVLESLVGAGHFSCLDLKSGFWQIKMDELLKQYTAFTVGNLGFFKCDCMPFGLCSTPATFQWLMQNCLGELNLIYCLIYLDDIVVYSQTAEEILHCLCIIFDQFREHNLKLKPSKCNLFREEITFLAYWVSKDGVQPSNSNLKATAKYALPQTYTEVCVPFLGWWATTEGSSRGLHALHSHSVNIWLEKGPAGRQSGFHFQKMPWRLLKCCNWCAWQLPFFLLWTTLNHSC